MKDDDPRLGPLLEHYEELLELGEVRATRLISSLVEGRQQTTLRDDANDENVYLPTTSGYRSCYYHYMKDQGYTATPQHDGAILVKWDGDTDADRAPSNYPKAATTATATTDTNADDSADTPLDDSHDKNWTKLHVSFITYYKYWKRLYPQLKVSKPAEDICVKCYQFAMQHKMLAVHKVDSLSIELNADEDNLLFRDDDGKEPDSNSGGEGDDATGDELANEATTTTDEGGNPNPAQESAAGGGEGVDTAEKQQAFEDEVLAKEMRLAEFARLSCDEAREQMMIRAAVHINTARV